MNNNYYNYNFPSFLPVFHLNFRKTSIVHNPDVQFQQIKHLIYKDYISLTDMANGKQSESRAADVIKNWIRTRYTIEFLGTWEMIHNPNFKVVEFDHFRMQAGLPSLA